jgi:hypothetical protein
LNVNRLRKILAAVDGKMRVEIAYDSFVVTDELRRGNVWAGKDPYEEDDVLYLCADSAGAGYSPTAKRYSLKRVA